MHVPKPLREPDCEETWARFQDIHQKWRLGREIYKDRVMVVKAGHPARSHSVAVRRADGSLKRLPNPIFSTCKGLLWNIQLTGGDFHMDSMES